MKILLLSFFLILCSLLYSQDTTFVKSYYGGSTVKVPENKIWFIEKAYITAGDGYNILIAKKNFLERYTENEVITFPYYIAEMELLSNRSMVSYFVTILERNEEK